MVLWKKLNRPGMPDTVMITPESGEDMYVIAALIEEGDVVTASTLRKVQREAGGASVSSRQLMRLGVEVDSTDLDADAGLIRAAGRVTTEVEHVKLGAHHTLELEPHRPFDLTKPHGWLDRHYAMLKEAQAAGAAADVIAVVMEEGTAYVCAVSGPITSVRAKVVTSVPKKRTGTTHHEKGLERFFDATMAALVRHADWAGPAAAATAASSSNSINAPAVAAAATPSSAVRPIIIASPGFLKDDFLSYMIEHPPCKEVTDAANKGRFLAAHSSAGHPRALRGVLADPSVAARLGGTRAASDSTALDGFLRALHTDPDTAVYGYRHVRAAAERAAVGSLLIVDSLLRAKDPAVRAGYAALVEEVNRGSNNSSSGPGSSSAVHVLAAGHGAGAQLAQMGGLAALLRFPVHDLEEAAAALPKAPGAAPDGKASSSTPGVGGGGADAYDSDASSDSDASFTQFAR